MKEQTIWRGSKRHVIQDVEKNARDIFSTGLWSRAGVKSGGNAFSIEYNDQTNLVRFHIDPAEDNVSENWYYDRSDFISFSYSEESARYFLTDEYSITLERCDWQTATRYMIEADLSSINFEFTCELYSIGTFRCNLSLRQVPPRIPPLPATIVAIQPCPICSAGDLHRLMVVEPQKIMGSLGYYTDDDLRRLDFTEDDDELLLLSLDRLENARDMRTTMIPRVDWWDIHPYREVV